jgi:hypothetical protein
MRRTLLITSLLALPVLAFALDFDDLTDRYTDAPFSTAETAGISVLTEIGAVSGNPDGTFAAQRTLNRAEFLKIALLSANQNPQDASGCFPDTPAEAWFTSYVCTAKNLGVVQGNPDGLYHPERPVNYVEALKILAELYDYTLPEPPADERWTWYRPYLLAANEHGVLLPENIADDTFLTRGQMARLAAAFVAEDEGELTEYRAFEKGQTESSSSSSSRSSSSSSSSSSVSSSSSLSSSSSSSSSSLDLNAKSRFLVAGTTTPVLYDGYVQATEEVVLQSVQLELYHDVTSLEALILVDEQGRQFATLALQTYSNLDDTKWRADFATGSYIIPANTPVHIGIIARMKEVGGGATSKELLEFKTVQLYTAGTQTSIAQQLVPTNVTHPSHQTAFGRVTEVKSTMGTSVSVQQGTQRQLGSFQMTGMSSGATVKATSVSFELQRTDVSVTNLKMGTSSPAQQADCATELDDGRTYLTCFVPESMQTLSSTPVTLSVFGDVTVAAAKQSGTLQLVSRGAGAVGQLGAVSWTDGSGVFNWVEPDIRLDSGPLMTVTK